MPNITSNQRCSHRLTIRSCLLKVESWRREKCPRRLNFQVSGERRRSRIRSDLGVIAAFLSHHPGCERVTDCCQVWPYAFCHRASCNILCRAPKWCISFDTFLSTHQTQSNINLPCSLAKQHLSQNMNLHSQFVFFGLQKYAPASLEHPSTQRCVCLRSYLPIHKNSNTRNKM